MPRVRIAAGGQSSRLREHMSELGYAPTFPKHLLPTGGPQGETFLGRIVRQTLDIPGSDTPIVYASEDNYRHITAHADIDPRARIIKASFPSSFVPFIDTLIETGEQTIGCAGDFYADIDWPDLIAKHNESPYPVTFVAGRTVPVERGLAFKIAEDGGLLSMQRAETATSGLETINVGIYIFDPVESVAAALTATRSSKEEVIAQRLIDDQLVGIYELLSMPFNVNTPATYAYLLEHTAQAAVVD